MGVVAMKVVANKSMQRDKLTAEIEILEAHIEDAGDFVDQADRTK